MARRNIGATLSLNNGNFFTNARSAISATNQLKNATTNAVGSLKNIGNQSANTGSALTSLTKKVITLAGAYASIQGLKKVLELSDTVSNTYARLDMMNDGLQSTQELQDKIFQSAKRSRADYQTTANVIAQLGTQAKSAFSSNDELIAFSEQLNKTFTIAGTSASGVESTMYNLTQALSSGVLRGQDLNSVFSNAQPIVQNIADYLKVPVGTIRDLAADGEISADVVKNAMLAAADKTNEKFSKMPMTFGQIMTSVKNSALSAFTPVLTKIGEVLNSERFQSFVRVIINSFEFFSSKVLTVFNAVSAVGVRALDKINESIVKISPKFSSVKDAADSIKNSLADAFTACQPVINWLIDTGIPLVVGLIGDVIFKATEMYSFISANWTLISPIVTGIAEAVLFYKGVLMVTEYWTKLVTFATGLWTGAVNLWNATTAGTFGVQAAWAAWRAKDIIETGILYALYAKDAVVKGIHTVATWGQVAATSALTAGQWLLNAAFIASPIGWIVLGIGLIVGAFMLLWKKCEPFRNFFIGMWEGFKVAISGFSGFFKGVINGIIGGVNWLISSFIGGINGLINGVNNISGAIGIPPIPNIPVPQIPGLWQGGDILRGGRVLVGERGAEILDLPTGARVTPLDKAQKTENNININVYVTGQTADEVVNEIVPKLKLALANL